MKIEPCSYEAAKFAVENWHYSHSMPAGALVKYGVWENDKFVGAVIFGRGANNNASKYFKLEQTECCELVRVALREHETTVTRIVSICLKLLQRSNKGLKLVFSYADETNQNHKGIIYKAGNWHYLGKRVSKGGHVILDGKLIHYRSINSKYKGKKNVPFELINAPAQTKHLFVYYLDKRLKPKSEASGFQPEIEGAVPI